MMVTHWASWKLDRVKLDRNNLDRAGISYDRSEKNLSNFHEATHCIYRSQLSQQKSRFMTTLQEIRLYENHTERENVDNMSELYAVLNALECLEKVFSRDYILPNEYTAECSKLLTQYKVTIRLLHGMSVEDFVRKYRINCPAALERIREDRPITVKDDRGNVLKNIAEIVELFITFMDHLKLNMRTVDELYPTLSDLYNALNTMSSLPDNIGIKQKIKNWHDKLSSMAASEEISEEDARQMVFEVESAYNDFNRHLRNT
uniref:Vacuolar protein sorting-associated protein 28 homolog n=1 Tax=Bursaphelenchus xylophilus TaxID=6326 RepID=A0A1I7RYD2_BURXY